MFCIFLKLTFQSHRYEDYFSVYFANIFFQFISSFYLCIFWWGELQILTKLNLFVCLFSAFHLGPVEKSFST